VAAYFIRSSFVHQLVNKTLRASRCTVQLWKKVTVNLYLKWSNCLILSIVADVTCGMYGYVPSLPQAVFLWTNTCLVTYQIYSLSTMGAEWFLVHSVFFKFGLNRFLLLMLCSVQILYLLEWNEKNYIHLLFVWGMPTIIQFVIFGVPISSLKMWSLCKE